MSNGRLEKETVEFAKIEEKLKFLPKIFTDYYYTIRAEKKSYSTISKYIMYINVFMRHFTDDKKDEEFYKKVTTMDFNKYMIRYLDNRYLDLEIQFNDAKGLKIPVSSAA